MTVHLGVIYPLCSDTTVVVMSKNKWDKKKNKVGNVLAMCLSNQVMSSHHIMMWHYDAVFVYRNGHYFIKRIT